jgi:YD repeat-containing protein
MPVAQGRQQFLLLAWSRLSFRISGTLIARALFTALLCRRSTLAAQWLLAAGLICVAPHARVDVQYAYDAAGRLVQVVAAGGSSAVYQYDSAGNIVAIQRVAAGRLAIASFNPTLRSSGTQVIIQGSGFSSTPANDSVTFSGAADYEMHDVVRRVLNER